MKSDRLEKLILDRFDRLEGKVDELLTHTIPSIQTQIAVAKAETTTEARTMVRLHGRIWGGITLAISLAGLALAYFK